MWIMYEYRNVYWDGNGGYYKTWYYSMPYANLVAKSEALGSGVGTLCIWLRGGTTAYWVSSDYDFTLNAYYAETNVGTSSYPVNIAPTTTVTTNGWQLISILGYGNIIGNATTATTATNLSAKPSLATSGNNITVTAGGKTSDAFTVPYATSAGTATSATTAGAFSSGTTVKLTGDTTGESSSSTKGWSINTSTKYLSAANSDVTTAPGTRKLTLSSRIINGTSGLFNTGNNANAIITINRHDGDYDS